MVRKIGFMEYGEKACRMDFACKEEFTEGLYVSEMLFKWNGCIGAVDACGKLRFKNLDVKWKLMEST